MTWYAQPGGVHCIRSSHGACSRTGCRLRAGHDRSRADVPADSSSGGKVASGVCACACACTRTCTPRRSAHRRRWAVVQVGGGGLISGIAAHIKHACPHVRVIGCQPTANACMAVRALAGRGGGGGGGALLTMRCAQKSVLQRRILSEAEAHCADTLSDGTAGGIEVMPVRAVSAAGTCAARLTIWLGGRMRQSPSRCARL